ncbi:membrane protein [Tetragenococcus muriaticus]|nr:membrane protein [Tetragenococcus muriaticus]
MEKTKDLLIDTCLLAGKIMMESGSEVYRVEDTMNRIAENANEPNSKSYVTATGIFMGLKSSRYTQIENVGERNINLEKVEAVNQLSRKFAEKSVDLPKLYQQLKIIDKETPEFPLILQVLSAAFLSAFLMILFGGHWINFIPTLFIGGFGFFIKHEVKQHFDLRFFDIFISSFLIGILALLFTRTGLALSFDYMCIGAVMPLVPGVAITASLRDILAGHLVSGLVRGTEAIIVAASIAIGIACVLSIFGGFFHDIFSSVFS